MSRGTLGLTIAACSLAAAVTIGSGASLAAPSPDTLDAYVRTRQEIARKDPGLAQRLRETADPSGERDRLEAVLAGARMSADEFLRAHRELAAEPQLRARVEAQLESTVTSGGAVITPTEPQAAADAPGTSGTRRAAPTGTAEARQPSAEMSEETLERYVQSRRQVLASDPDLARAMDAGELSGQRDRLTLALAGAPMSPEEFLQAHREVAASQTLRARAQAALEQAGRSGRGAPRAAEPTGGAEPGSSPK